MGIKVGYIGLGKMGMPLATNILKAGFELAVYDVREEPGRQLAALGARAARSPREVAEHADIIGTSVVDDAQVEAIVLGPDGMLEGARPGSILAVHSTIYPETVKRLASITRPRGLEIIDAQVSGGSEGARNATLCYMVGGDEQLLERCRPVFAASGKHIFHMGELGTGAAAKLAQQIVTTVNMLAAFEGMSVAEAAGLKLDSFDQLLRVSAGQSYMADRWLERRKQLGPDGGEGFYKGLIPALKLGHELGVSLPGTSLFQQLVNRMLG